MRAIFKYIRPLTSGEACQLKTRYKGTARCLAGGSDLLLQWRRGEAVFDYCIDLTFISDLKYYECTNKDLRIGALTTLADLENAEALNSYMACIKAAVKQMCTPQLRTLATVGGNLCNASPAADLAVLFLAMGAEVKILGSSSERQIPLEVFFIGVNKTKLGDDEILTDVRIPLPTQKTGVSFSRVGRTVVDIAQVNAAVCITVGSDGVVGDAKIVLGAVAPTPIRSKAAEKILLGLKTTAIGDDVIERAAVTAAADGKPISDIRASAEYRSYISKVLVRRSIEDSIRSINGG